MGPRSRRETNGNKTRAGPRSPAAATVRPSVRSPAAPARPAARPRQGTRPAPAPGPAPGAGSAGIGAARRPSAGKRATAPRPRTNYESRRPPRLRKAPSLLPSAGSGCVWVRGALGSRWEVALCGYHACRALGGKRLCVGTTRAGLSRGSSQVPAGPSGARLCVRMPGVRGGEGMGTVIPGAHCEGGGAGLRRWFGQGDSGVEIVTFFSCFNSAESGIHGLSGLFCRASVPNGSRTHGALGFSGCWNFPSSHAILNNL